MDPHVLVGGTERERSTSAYLNKHVPEGYCANSELWTLSLRVLESNDESERLRSERIWSPLKFHPAWITAWSVPGNKRKEAARGVFVFTVYWFNPIVGSILAGHACDNKNGGKSLCLVYSISRKSL